MTLDELLRGIETIDIAGEPTLEVAGIQTDSRRVGEGDVFVAIPGFRTDGSKYAESAVRRGATVVVTETELSIEDATVVRVADARKAAASLASRALGDPSASFLLIGVTGTSGKTTTTRMIESILDQTGDPVGLIGTIEYRAGTVRESADRTTPDSVALQEWFARMREEKVKRAVMEVSSHALSLDRTWGVEFDVALFTNLSRDHFDFHDDFEDYFQAKRKLFDQIPKEGRRAIVNIDDEYGARLAEELGSDRVVTFGFDEAADIHPVERFSISIDGLDGSLVTPWGELAVRSSLIGKPNLYNWMGAIGAALAGEVAIDVVEQGVSSLERIAGRFERVDPTLEPAVLIDYAHKPDAIEKLLESVRQLVPDSPVVIAFGCGGDRDKGKRALMGASAARLADKIILTSDNPRSENPQTIIDEIRKGIAEVGHDDVTTEPDRREAIRIAIEESPNDAVVIIAGKGHEDYQVVGDEIVHFDDREEALIVLRKKNNEN